MSVGRALAILQVLAGNASGLRLAEVANALSADRANVLRILGEMERCGFVFHDPMSDRYRLTFLVTALGFRHLDALGVGDWVDPVLEQLAGTTQELVRLAVLDRGVLRWVAKAQGANSALILDPEMGSDVVLHATSVGKAWLAALTDEAAVQTVMQQGFRPRTPSTIRTVEALLTELGRVRERGYAVAIGEGDETTLAVAALIRARVPRPSWQAGSEAGRRLPFSAVRGSDPEGPGVPVGTVSVAGPAPRVTPERLQEWAPYVIDAAALLGEMWGPYVTDLVRAVETGAGPGTDGRARAIGRSRRNGRR